MKKQCLWTQISEPIPQNPDPRPKLCLESEFQIKSSKSCGPESQKLEKTISEILPTSLPDLSKASRSLIKAIILETEMFRKTRKVKRRFLFERKNTCKTFCLTGVKTKKIYKGWILSDLKYIWIILG